MKPTINSRNDDDKCFIYAITVALNHQEIGDHPERVSKKLLNHTFKYNWNKINFPSQRKDWERFEKNNYEIALNILSVIYGRKTIELQYKSKHNHTRRNQVVLLMITDNTNCH